MPNIKSPTALPAMDVVSLPEAPHRRASLGWILLIALSVLPYLNALRGDFVFDDKWLVTSHPEVQGPFRLGSVLTAPLIGGAPETAIWRPVTTLSLALDWRIGGGHSFWFHLVNLFAYAGITVLWTLLVRRIFRSLSLAMIAGLLFAAHPLHTEAVAWISGRGELLAALFGLIALHLALAERHRVRPWAFLAIFLALGSKETAAIVPFLILYTLWVTRRPHRPWSWRFGLSCFAPVLVFLVLRHRVTGIWLAAGVDPADNPLVGTGIIDRIPTVLDCAGRYLALLLVPGRLSLDYAPPVLERVRGITPHLVAGLLGTGGLAVLAWRQSRRPEGWGAVWALITFALASNLLVVAVTIFAERLLFLPSAGLLLIPAAAGLRGSRRSPGLASALRIVLALALAGGAVRTWIRNADYRNELTLYTAGVRAAPKSYKMRVNLCLELARLGHSREALKEARQALRLNPASRDSRDVIACSLDSLGQKAEAVQFLEQSLQSDPKDGRARKRLLLHLLDMRQADRLEAVAEEGRRQAPSEIEWVGWAAVAVQAKRDWTRAAELWRTVMQRLPQALDAPIGLGNCLLQAGDNQGARDAYAEALRRAPESAAAANGLAWTLLLTGGSPAEAVRLAEQATAREPIAPYFDTLARAALAAGSCDRAREAAERACAIDPGDASHQETKREVLKRCR
jgi:tetratricopeptide (TPR) repeat protein